LRWSATVRTTSRRPKVGPKTAAKWLNEYGSADGIVAHAKDIAGKVGESLRDNLDTLELSKKLATIRRDLDLPLSPAELTRKPLDVDALSALYKRLELNSLLRQLSGSQAPAAGGRDAASERLSSGGASESTSRPPAPAREYETITTEPQLTSWLKALDKAPLFAFDTETTSLDYMQAEIVGVSFCIEPGKAAYLPLAHNYPGAPDQLDRKATLAKLKPMLEDAKRPKVGHHLKYDAHVLKCCGIELAGMRYDSMLESYVLNSTATRHDMDSCAKLYLGVDTIKYEESPARARSRSRSTRSPSSRPRLTPLRMPTSRCSCTASSTLRSKRNRRFFASTRKSSSLSCRSCSKWSTTACWSIASS
jgi:DNA polymerase-1